MKWIPMKDTKKSWLNLSHVSRLWLEGERDENPRHLVIAFDSHSHKPSLLEYSDKESCQKDFQRLTDLIQEELN